MQKRLSDILDFERWNDIQNSLSKVLGITIVTLDREKNFITEVSTPFPLYKDVIVTVIKTTVYSSKSGFVDKGLSNLESDWKRGIQCCGYYMFFIPLKIDEGGVSAYILVGPVIVGKREGDNYYHKGAMKLDIEPQQFIKTMKNIKAFTFYGITAVIELLHNIANYVIQLAYLNDKLEDDKKNLSAIPQKIDKIYMEKLLNALLEMSFNFTEAQRGSLMLVDEDTGELYIKKALGISKEVVEKTRLRIGEGIAGVVAQDKKSFFIDADVKDERIKKRLHKPEIKSAISLPIQLEDKLLGILNISTTDVSSDKVSLKSMETIDTLIRLVETAIKDFSING